MGRFRKYLSAIFLLSLAIASTCMGISICEAKGLDYFFGSDSINYLYPDNSVTINVDDKGYATILTRLHAKSSYPTGIGDLIEIPVPYPPDRVVVVNASVSNSNQPAYKVIGAENQTTIQVKVQESPREAYVDVIYIVKEVYDGSKFNIRLLPSSFTTEISIRIIINNKETWINRKSVKLNPNPSKETYFFISEEALPFFTYIVLSNVNPKVVEFSLETQAAPYGLEVIPYYAMAASIIPAALFLLTVKIIKIISGRRRAGMVVLAYRNLYRRLGQFILTILGVGIPAMLIVQMLIQSTLAKKMLGPETPRMEWYIALILIITIVIGCFQVFNTVLSSVLERMRELGVMKAIGFNPSYIFKMVITEATFIGLIAGLLGSLLVAALTIISTQILYGLSISNQMLLEIMANSFGISWSDPLGNPFIKNYIIAYAATMGIVLILASLSPFESEVSGLFFVCGPLLLFFILLRPTDPFTVDRLIEIAPTLAVNILTGVFFTVILSISAASYVAYLAGKIKPSEAMRHV